MRTILGSVAVLLLLGASSALADDARPPNIVLILADDLGWRDTGFSGSDFIETPRLDKLASEGTVFTHAYACAANCAPSRAALLSGQYAPRTGVYTVGSPERGRAQRRKLLTPSNKTRLAPEVVTIAEVLKTRGYATASIGKWHLGEGEKDGPTAQGFDVNVAGNRRGAPRSYFSPYKNKDLEDGPEGEHLTKRLTDEAIRFVEKNARQPFFLYLPYFAVHTPIQPSPDLRAKYEGKVPGVLHQHAGHAALVEGMDRQIGRLLDTLDAQGLTKDTVVVFTSDNGGSAGATRMTPLRGSKGMYYEGGIRVPFAVRWPGRIPGGKRRPTPISGIDLYPTLASVAGATVPPTHALDGVDLRAHWEGAGAPKRDALYWHFPAYLEAGRGLGLGPWRTTPVSVIRKGRYKLLEFFEDGRLELYDLNKDKDEGHNLVEREPDRAKALHADLVAWRQRVGAPVPAQPNPAYRPRPARTVAAYEQRLADERPNIVYILADDLGYGELGSYGQQKIKTPHLDRMAKEGLRFTQHYAGSPVCAPSRCVLMTGRHPGQAYVRNNRGRAILGQQPIPPGTPTVGRMLKRRGYRTACIGKWGMGGPNTRGVPWRQGFDHFFGYLDQWRAHTHHPTYLYRNGVRVPLDNPLFRAHQKLKEPPADATGYAQYAGPDYAPDRMIREALDFVQDNRDRPFFLYFATPVPHVALQVPEDSLSDYPEDWDTKPYLGQKGYLPHRRPRAAYAAMITRMDAHIGQLMEKLKSLGLDEKTLVIFSSDNGPTYAGGVDYTFFESAGPLRGLKGSVYEGGIRVPMIARWPGRVAPGTSTDHVSAFQDVMPTLAELTGAELPSGVTSTSFLPTLLGKEQAAGGPLYFELGRLQAVRAGDLKLVRKTDRKGRTTTELFDLAADPGEQTNLAEGRAEDTKRLVELARSLRTPSRIYKSPYDDGR